MKLKCQKCGEWSCYISGGLVGNYTCDKCNKITIKDLKVGDKVKFYWKNKNYIGEITNFDLNWFYIKESCNIFHDWIYKDNIISKLEPLPPQYKEIKIEQNSVVCSICGESPYMNYWYDIENDNKLVCQTCHDKNKLNKSPIKISDLKVGDKIKFRNSYEENGYVRIGQIQKIGGCKHDKYNHDFLINEDGMEFCVYKKDIICKLEPIYNGFTDIPEKYKEIPIEKENNGFIAICDLCYDKFKVQTMDDETLSRYICEYCKKYWTPIINKEEYLPPWWKNSKKKV